MYDGRGFSSKKLIMINNLIFKEISSALSDLYSAEIKDIQFQSTRKEFAGDITLVVFPFLSISKKNPSATANEIGLYLKKNVSFIKDFNVINGFLNIEIKNIFWFNHFSQIFYLKKYGIVDIDDNSPTYLIEFSSPNTNKPIHLGHLRNNFLGYSVAQIIKASGKNVKKVQVINDRGIHICKSMVAWQEFGNNETPLSSGVKGDHLVGKYYVEFDKNYKKQVAELVESGMVKDLAEKQAPIFLKAKDMLIKWEANDTQVRNLWKTMNSWVYEGFADTYKRLGIDFDKNYYESNTYLLGKEIVEFGLEKEVFFRKEDGSVWIDLSDEGLDEKIVLRSDGTAVYMTQDIGTAIQRHNDFKFSHMAYTVANEQDYHFKVLFLILDKLGYKWAKNCYHLSYGMVDLPSGKMKSREGTVIDADDFIDEMVNTAQTIANDLGKLEGLSNEDANQLYEIVGLGALKYFMLKVDPRKRMLFNPVESVDFNGNTGPFIQYAYARIQSLIRKRVKKVVLPESLIILDKEQVLIKKLLEFPSIIQDASDQYSPAILANFIYDLVKNYNNYYQSTPILTASSEDKINFRLALSIKVGEIIKTGMALLGCSVPKQM
jgi:arginyl-tRNA synthetase